MLSSRGRECWLVGCCPVSRGRGRWRADGRRRVEGRGVMGDAGRDEATAVGVGSVMDIGAWLDRGQKQMGLGMMDLGGGWTDDADGGKRRAGVSDRDLLRKGEG
ncbi:hypothetical protein ACLOJK_024129 [Asimina triloba]